MKKIFLQEKGHLHINDLAMVYGIKCVRSFFKIEYWKVCYIDHDVYGLVHLKGFC
jgi:hypothetical protein